MKKITILLLMISAFALQSKAQKVSNVTATQNGKQIIVSYKIEGGYADRVYSPTLYYSTNGGADFNKCKSTKANRGKPNQTNQITWNVTNDLDYFGKENIVFKVNAYGFWNYVKGTATIGGRTYKTIKIGQQEWMAQNLNYDVGYGCYCYENKQPNCNKYGKLYTWAAAKLAAAEIIGWHLSSDTEWTQLENLLGGSSNAGKKLKSTSGWKNSGNGTNSSGFSALAGGYRYGGGRFCLDMGSYVGFWTASTGSSSRAWRRYLSCDDSEVSRDNDYEDSGYSVRLVRD